MTVPRLQFRFLFLALLCCSITAPAGAQSGGLEIIALDVSLGYGISGETTEAWLEHLGVWAYDPAGGSNVTRVSFETPGGRLIEKTPATSHPRYWVVDGNYVTVGWFDWRPTMPTLGQYHITVYNGSGASADVWSSVPVRIPDRAPTDPWPRQGSTATDTQPVFSAVPVPADELPYPGQSYYTIGVHGPQEEWSQENWVWATDVLPALGARFNFDGTAGVPELTPGTTYTVVFFHSEGAVIDPGGSGRPQETHAEQLVRWVDFTIASSAPTGFESERYPWAGFAAGPGSAEVRREVLVPVGAHAGAHAMAAEVADQGVAGLRLDLPVGPTDPTGASVRTWVYVEERTAGDSSTFFGFGFSDDYPSSAAGWGQAVGWEVLSDTESRLQLGGSSVALPFGLAAGGWHLVRVNYHRADNAVRVWVDGQLVADETAPGIAGQGARYAILGALGEGAGARQVVRFDDTSLLPMLDAEWPAEVHAYARIEGLEQVVEGEQESYTVCYGNGYPVLGAEPVSETLADLMYVGVSIPSGYSLVSADPAPSRAGGGALVWELATPAFGQEGYIQLEVMTPTGISSPMDDRLWAWATSDPGGSVSDPPAPPDWSVPCAAVWGCPEDVLAQAIFPAEDLTPDVWVRKDGPRYASPGDTINYIVTVGNRGLAAAEDLTVKDDLPEELGNGTKIVGNIDLKPGETWRGPVSGVLEWGVLPGTLLLNLAYVPTAPGDPDLSNNTAERRTTVLAAHDPNEISVEPAGGVDRGGTLTYTVHCENTGAGTAYGVYASVSLDPKLDASTLVLPPGVSYERASRTLTWEVGTLAAGGQARTSFTINVGGSARRARAVMEQAVVYFPSVPEETPTNIVVNVVNGSFPDVPWDHWAVGEIESTFEAGIVQGYPNGQYRPTVAVTRDQMAVFVARAMASGDANVPTGPAVATFPDVPTDHWAYQYVEYAVDREVVEGFDNGTYRPTLEVDRGQMAVYMARALAGGESNVPPPMPPATFSDVGPGTAWEWCWPHVEYIAAKGVAGGYEDGTYRPATTCTRDQMAVYVTRGFRLPM